MTACCQPVRRTAGWYHSRFCEEHRNEPLGSRPFHRGALHDRPALRAEIASHATRSHDWARCDVTDCERCEYVEAHLDDADDRFPA
jgi:hypothetical protein